MRRWMMTLTVALLATGCGQTRLPSEIVTPTPASRTQTPKELPSSAAPTSDTINGIEFVRPVGWIRWQPNERDPMVGGPIVYLSTEPLNPECAVESDATPNPVGPTAGCQWPLDELAPNGVFIEWIAGRLLQPMPTRGDPIRMAAGETVLLSERPGPCLSIGADETITVVIPMGMPTPLSNASIVACLRGPDLALTEARVRALIESSTGP